MALQIFGNIFNALIFTSVIGSIFTCVRILAERVAQRISGGQAELPLWSSAAGMLLFIVPFLSADVHLISPEKQSWLEGFWIMAGIWAGGTVVFLGYDTVVRFLGRCALKRLRPCEDENLREIFYRCARSAGIKNMPGLYWGNLPDPACVVDSFRPKIILNEQIISRLDEKEMTAVLLHEAVHIKRRHLLMKRVSDYICIINWFNPLAWMARKEFGLNCEMDCDRTVLRISRTGDGSCAGGFSEKEYAGIMLRLFELSGEQAEKQSGRTGALGFFMTRRRIQAVTGRRSGKREWITAGLFAGILCLVIAFSMSFSREHFYPYPAYDSGAEYSSECGIGKE